MGMITNDKIILIHPTCARGTQVDTYRTMVEMVLNLINSAEINGDGCYGDEQHCEALNQIERGIVLARSEIVESRKRWQKAKLED